MEPTLDQPGLRALDRTPAPALAPDHQVRPEGFVVAGDGGVRIHFLDWGGPVRHGGVLLVPGIARTAWDWAPVARRLIATRRVVAMDLRGHGLSDAPFEGYDARGALDDVRAVIEGALADRPSLTLAGHGYGATVAALAAQAGRSAVGGLVLVDGGWERVQETTGQDVEEALRALDEPPEVMRSMGAFLADRRGWDPATWDADQERAARESVVETAAGRLVRSVRPHALEASLRVLYAYDPLATLSDLDVPIAVLAARDDDDGRREVALRQLGAARVERSRSAIRIARFPSDGHNLLRYRPAEVAAAILAVTEGST